MLQTIIFAFAPKNDHVLNDLL